MEVTCKCECNEENGYLSNNCTQETSDKEIHLLRKKLKDSFETISGMKEERK